jgi:hypothetical protein
MRFMSISRVLKVTGHRTQSMPTWHSGVMGYSVRVLKAKPKAVVRLSAGSERTFRKISEATNAHLFTAEAALQAFADVQT